MKIKFIGATDNHVTGSCTLFSYERKKIKFLVDCGLHQGEAHSSLKNEQKFPFNPSDIKFVILTHAHIDHCGLIPKLYRDGFCGVVFCTSATAELARISLFDGQIFSDGLYSIEDVKRIKFSCVDNRTNFELSKFIPLDDDLFVSFTRTAHILGAVSLKISWHRDDGSKGDIVMSGDIGNNTKKNPYQPLLAGRQEPFGVPEYIVVESTYGDRKRESKYSSYEGRIEALSQIIKTASLNRRKLLIPAFSLQRTQELLLDLTCIFRETSELYLPRNIPIIPVSKIEESVSQKWWDKAINGHLGRTLSLESDEVQNAWNRSVIAIEEVEGVASKFTIDINAEVSFDDFRNLLMQSTKPLSIKITVDSPLTHRMTGVFSEQLNRRQQKEPTKTIYRNRKMSERLKVETESEVDDILKEIFPNNLEIEDSLIAIGSHQLAYKNVSRPTGKQIFPKKKQLAVKKTVPSDFSAITISGAGMCEGGRIVSHLECLLASDKATILITGYMAPNTLGGKLSELGRCRDDATKPSFTQIEVNGTCFNINEVKANIINFGGYYSGHADQDGLLNYIFQNAKFSDTEDSEKSSRVFLNHGGRESRIGLKNAIENYLPKDGQRKIWEVILSNSDKWYDLDAHVWLEAEVPDEMITSGLIKELLQEQKKTNFLLQQLVDKFISSHSIIVD